MEIEISQTTTIYKIQLISKRLFCFSYIQVNIGISNMGYLEYPGYVAFYSWSRPFSLYICKNYFFFKLLNYIPNATSNLKL